MWEFNLSYIAERREKLGYTQRYVAKSLGISNPAYYRYEKGISRLRADMLPALAKILKVSIHKFFIKLKEAE